MAGTIGIKIANGDFYPLTEENLPAKKKLVLTTVHDGQGSVQIDLFRSISKTMLDAQYIGSLVVENINPKPKGEPSIEMVISSDSNGNIAADAIDLDVNSGGEHHTLNVSLKSMDTPGSFDDFPDFDLENDRAMPSFGLYQQTKKDKENRKFPWLVMVLATVFVILVIIMIWFFFLGGRNTLLPGRTGGRTGLAVEAADPASPPSEAQPPAPVVVAPPPSPPPPVTPPPPAPVAELPPPAITDSAEVPVIRAPVSPPAEPAETVERVRPPSPVLSYTGVPAVIPREGVVYSVQWGDTLWDISDAFYRDPWLYPRIAEHNGITDPDHIRAEFPITIPPKE